MLATYKENYQFLFLRSTAGTAIARISHRNSVRLSVCPSVRPSVRPSVTRVDQSKTVQARITTFSPSATRKTLVSGSVKFFHKFEGSHPERGRKMRGGGKILRF